VRARVAIGARELEVDLAQPLSLAVALEFEGAQPRHFGAPPASAHAWAVPGFAGAVAAGAGCNCEVISLIPHCNGTHTECVGHLTRERLDAHRVIPAGLIPALLLSVAPEPAADGTEDSVPAPRQGDTLITRRALEGAWRETPFTPQALAIRTLPNERAKRTRDYSGATPPYLSRQAAQFLVARGIWHLIVDVPSIDRAHDEGRLTAHRIFFGLPADSVQLAAAQRAAATVTEFAFMPDEASDGAYLAELQAPALGGDAVPSRPLLYRLGPH
jgi:arylformamidase